MKSSYWKVNTALAYAVVSETAFEPVLELAHHTHSSSPALDHYHPSTSCHPTHEQQSSRSPLLQATTTVYDSQSSSSHYHSRYQPENDDADATGVVVGAEDDVCDVVDRDVDQTHRDMNESG